MLGLNLIYFLLAFVGIWIGSGMVVASVNRFARKLQASSFAISFLLLGVLTSTPEIGVGIAALGSRQPEIFVGNLLGGIVLIFFLIIPLLAVVGDGIKLDVRLKHYNLILCFAVICAPALFILDKVIAPWEALVSVLAYIFLFVSVQRQRGLLDGSHTQAMHLRQYSFADLLKVLVGVGMVFGASKMIVVQTQFFARYCQVSPLLISLLLLSVGTNLPEVSIGFRSVLAGQKQVAFGNYIGSATVNTLLFGFFSLFGTRRVVVEGNFYYLFIITLGGSWLFYHFARSGYHLSRREGSLLLLVYLAFLIFELLIR